MSKIQRPSQKVFIFDPESEKSYEAPTTDFDENKRRERTRKNRDEEVEEFDSE